MRWLQGCGTSGEEEGIVCSGVSPSCRLSQGLLYFLCEQVSMILGLCQPGGQQPLLIDLATSSAPYFPPTRMGSEGILIL